MLDSFFFHSAARLPDANALWVDGGYSSYQRLAECADRVASALQGLDTVDEGRSQPSPCLLFAHRSEAAYAGVLGILAAGRAYVPLNKNFPKERNAAIARRSGCRVLLVDERCSEALAALMPLLDPSIQVIAIETLMRRHEAAQGFARRERSPGDTAYVLFTSGTTGVPKGVMVTHANASTYMRSQLQLDPAPADSRFSQVFDLTFDLSVHDMFVCWGNGGCLYVPPSTDALELAAFVPEHRLTHWASVPSTGSFMQQFRKLKPAVFPDLQYSMFCGEAFPAALARDWSRAAPNSRILNLYGPTEATISCLRFEVEPGFLEGFDGGVLPLGVSLPGEETVIVDEAGKPVAPGCTGELLLGGHQLAAGYVSENPADHARFFECRYPDHVATRWYRTGDLASVNNENGLVFHGRLDTQVKIRGNRIELQEIEYVIKRCTEAAMVCVVAWPRDKAGMAAGLVAFMSGADLEDAWVLAECRKRLPLYAIPNRVVQLETLPLNVNGKVDRNALTRWCDEQNTNKVAVTGR